MNKETNHTHDSLPQYPESYWRDSVELPIFPRLNENKKADAVIVGGGIAGITTAYLLVKEGLSVILLEASTILNGTTGHTTAKITAQHDVIYDELINKVGLENARLYYQANMDAIHFIKQTIQDHSIDCGYSEQDAYLYTNSEEGLTKLKKEAEAYKKLGIQGEEVEKMPLDVPLKGSLVMKNQAKFHPLQYLATLVKYILEHGGSIYEHTTAEDVEKVNVVDKKVTTADQHEIVCSHVVSCSHFPFHDGLGFYFARMYAERSYVLAYKTDNDFPEGMYLSVDTPQRSVRTTPLADGQKLVIIGGGSHKTGQGICTIEYYEALQEFAEKKFGLRNISYRWSAQDLITTDKIPYIGKLSGGSEHIYVATGFRKWGMSQGTLSALLLRDIILKRENQYEKLYSPTRFDLATDGKNLAVQNADVAKHLIAGKLEIVREKAENLAHGQGGVVSVNGKRAGAYRDEEGELYVVDTTCTHMGCEVEWNEGERSWDCPCHGSRFSYTGDVMEGPAKKSLARLQTNTNNIDNVDNEILS
ncbi:FAD-dependent oxidoreductase [Bacillus horti]|uniref:Glycine/D-amino acid oxidase-like deaminating enzyme/nitrite reductase/ring-hydroxylating ferredoxin subunit n=1 Tax=Caldalkalibacillus horti TaxID=77523 RepID=A0ABT9VX87_9BACI|nr:FAD-dependent oxidoreductase [Bacillus horti]MDQ0165598.1 glycine/D-amino acid oxidase-like deaminating enzyme/nitrite reductase/ring-hydroxylating ferredoxin subunit [Bacillus horti]